MQGDNAAKAGKGTRRKEDSPSTDGEVSKHMTWIKDKVTRKGEREEASEGPRSRREGFEMT